MIGRRFGRYTMARKLGEGSFAEVFLADEDGGGLVAIKVLRPSHAQDEHLLDRFRNEWECAKRLQRHHNVVWVKEVARVDERPALVMEYVEGPTVQELLDEARGRGLGVALALRLAHDVSNALKDAHALQIMHRDVKPSNCLMWRETKRAMLADFGIATPPSGKRLTRSGTLGTRGYRPKDVILGGPWRPSSDVYATGVLLFEMIAGSHPFPDDNEFVVERRMVDEAAPAPSTRVGELPDGIDELVLRCLDRDPAKRPPDGGALRDLLTALRNDLHRRGIDAGLSLPEDLTAMQPPPGSPPARAVVLVNLAEPLRPAAHTVGSSGLWIGYDDGNDVMVRHPRVSGRHAWVGFDNQRRVVLTDQSRNGTWMNGQKAYRETVPLSEHALLRLGAADGPRLFVLGQ